MEQVSTATVERGIEESVAAHPSNPQPVLRSGNLEKPKAGDTYGSVDPLGAMAIGLANGISVRHGIDALRISDTGGEIDGNMSRSDVFDQAERVEAPETLGLSGSPEEVKDFMQQRRESYLEFLGMTKEEIAENEELLGHFELDTLTGRDGLEHILFGDTRYEDLGGEGFLTAEGLHFLPAAKKIGLEVTPIKDYTRKFADAAQRARGVKVSRFALEGVEKANPTSMFPAEYPDTGMEVPIPNLLRNIKYALDNAQRTRPSDVKVGNSLTEFSNEDFESEVPSMRIVTNEQGKIVSAFPIRK